jgi:hypothetical protein
MGKAGRQRRLRQEKERERRRAHQAAGPGAGPATEHVPSQRDLAVMAIGEVLAALRDGGRRDAFGEYLDVLAIEGHRAGRRRSASAWSSSCE